MPEESRTENDDFIDDVSAFLKEMGLDVPEKISEDIPEENMKTCSLSQPEKSQQFADCRVLRTEMRWAACRRTETLP